MDVMMEDFVDVNVPDMKDKSVDDNVAALELSVIPKHKNIGVNSSLTTTQACVTVKARDLPEEHENFRAPVDIVVALDVSGSMYGNKLELCKLTLKLLLRTLGVKDRFGLVSYGSEAQVEIPAQYMNSENKERALRIIEKLRTIGRTNIAAAIELASKEMKAITSSNEVRTIFLLTDGLANEGISDENGLVDLTKQCLLSGNNGINQAQEGPPINMHTFGYGSDHNESLLKNMSASTPGGSYYFVENDSAVGTAFGDALGGILSIVAQNVVITIQACEKNRITKVFHERAILRENGSYTIDLGDFYAEECRDCLFEMELVVPTKDETNPSFPIPHAQTHMAYTDTIKKIPVTSHETPIICSIIRPSGSSEVSKADPHIKEQILRISAVEEMKAAEKMARERNYEGARKRMTEWKTMATNECDGDEFMQQNVVVQQLFADIGQCQDGLKSERTYQTKGCKTMATRYQSHDRQRCAESVAGSASAYRTKKKGLFSVKMKF